MREFSISRVANYMRYCYTVQARNYAWNVLSMFAVPLFFAVLAEDMFVASEMSTVVYIVAAVVFPAREMWLMRDRGTRNMTMTLPVSNEERLVATIINLAILLPIVSMVTSVLSIVVAEPFTSSVSNSFALPLDRCIVSHLYNFYLLWPVYVFMQVLSSSSLLLAIMARRSLVLAYVGAFVGVILFVYCTVYVVVDNEWFLNIEAHIESVEIVGKTLFCLLPALFYVLSYVALRKRQIKW